MPRRLVSAGLWVPLLPLLWGSGLAEGKPEGGRALLRVVPVGPLPCEPQITVTARSAEGRALASERKTLEQGGTDLVLPAESRLVDVSSPIHEPCVVEAELGLFPTCSLRALRTVDPFRGEPGALFAREAGGPSAFRPIPPLPRGCGPGFALPPGALDLVGAPAGGPADLYLSPNLPEFRSPRGPQAAGILRARFVDSAGCALTARASVTVDIPEKVSPSDRPALEAWAAFVSGGAAIQAENEIAVSPVPAPHLVFLVEFPGMSVVRLANRGMPVDGVLDFGEIRVPARTRLRVQLRVPESVDPSEITVRPVLVRPLPGIHPPAVGAPAWTPWAGEPLLFELFPGEWDVAVRLKGMNVGKRRIDLPDGGLVEPEAIDVGLREVAGRVVDTKGEGVADVEVFVSAPGSPGVDEPDTTTGDSGRFLVTFLHAGGNVTVRARRSREGLVSSSDIDPEDPSSADLTIEIPTGGFSLRLQDEKTGEAISNARVDLVIVREGGTSHWARASSPTGMVTVEDLGAARIEAEIRAGGYETATVTATLRAGDDEVREVRLRRSGKARARVLRPGGSPLPGATVAGPLLPSGRPDWEPPRVLTDSEGEFEVEVPSSGDGTFAIWAPGYRVTFVRLGPESDGRRIVVLERGPDTILELVESDGSPIRGAHVLVSPGDVSLLSAGEFVESAMEECGTRLPGTNREGQTALGGCLAPGHYLIGVRRIRGSRLVDEPIGSFVVPSSPRIRITAPERGK